MLQYHTLCGMYFYTDYYKHTCSMKYHFSRLTKDLHCVPWERTAGLAPVASTIETFIVAVLNLKVACVPRLEKDIFLNVALCYHICGLQYIKAIPSGVALLPGDTRADCRICVISALKGNYWSSHKVAGVIDEDV